MSPLKRLLVLYGSTRPGGNSEALAARVLEGIPHEAIYLREHRIDPLDDLRHDPGGFPPAADDHDAIMERMLQSDVVLVVTPLYWYGPAGHLKLFMDRWSQSLRTPALNFRERMQGKPVYLVVVGGDQPRIEALPFILQFKLALDYMKAHLAGYIIGKGNRPGEVEADPYATATADVLNQELRQRLSVTQLQV